MRFSNFHSTATITEGNNTLNFTYGPNQQRKKTELLQQGAVVKTTYFLPAYEEITQGTDTYKVHYVGSQAICVQHNNNQGELFYTYTDHLGSLLTLTDNTGNTVFEQNGVYPECNRRNAWGNHRNPQTWTSAPFTGSGLPWLIRGFTGHEHLPEFALINMNGRTYDPLLGRMLSVDNFVQDATSTQGYNRYSYVRNNPLKYTDPSGELYFIIPSIGFSPNGGFSIGLTAGIGIPGVSSAQVSLGYNFKSRNASISVGGTLDGATASVGIGTKTGFTAGLNYSLPGFRLGNNFGSNLGSAGLNYSQNGGVSANAFGGELNQQGQFSFNPSISYSRTFVNEKDPIYAPALYASLDGDPIYTASAPVFEVIGYRRRWRAVQNGGIPQSYAGGFGSGPANPRTIPFNLSQQDIEGLSGVLLGLGVVNSAAAIHQGAATTPVILRSVGVLGNVISAAVLLDAIGDFQEKPSAGGVARITLNAINTGIGFAFPKSGIITGVIGIVDVQGGFQPFYDSVQNFYDSFKK